MLVTHFKLRSSESEVSVQFLFDKNMQDWKYLHTVSWIGQYPCITMNESMLVSSNHSHCQLSPVCERARYCVEDERVIFKSSVTQSLHFISQTLHILLVMHLSSTIFFKNLQVFIFKYLWKIHQFRQAKRHSQSYHTKAEASSSMRPHFEQKPEEAFLQRQDNNNKRLKRQTTATKFNSKKPDLSGDRFSQSSILFRRIKSRAYFWKSLVRGRTILKGKVIVVNVHLRNHVLVWNLK